MGWSPAFPFLPREKKNQSTALLQAVAPFTSLKKQMPCQCTVQEISHSLNQVTPQAPNTMNAHRLPTTESLELLCLMLNSQQCKSSCAFPHVTAPGLKARTTPWSTVTRAVSQDVCAFLLICHCQMQKLIQWQK